MPQPSPFRLFAMWYRAAVSKSPGDWFDPTAMTLATADKNGRVTARIVLLKKFGPEGFTFFTNYGSRKGRQLNENPQAALVLYWPHLRRQIRIEGRAERVSSDEAESYFHSRPRPSQIAAAASQQSEIIPSRKFLLDRFKQLQKEFAGNPVPLPETWGGYRLIPESIEFWHHRENRLHDRLRYGKDANGSWTAVRLSP
jgi:pyridoxamine 5'-phosphate oxidase